MEYMLLFFTQSGAIKYDKHFKKSDIPCSLMPVPRKLSSSCGIGAKVKYMEDIKNIISDDIEKIYKIENSSYILLYEAE